MQLVEKLDEYGKGAWIAVMVLGFILFWPIGLAILAYIIWSGRMACWKRGKVGRWHYEYREGENGGHTGHHHNYRRRAYRARPTDNHAFEEYREETLRRLEEEQAEFEDFLEKLRHAEDKAQFERFMDERRNRPDDIEGEANEVDPEPPVNPNTDDPRPTA